jgi:hypothetical protein
VTGRVTAGAESSMDSDSMKYGTRRGRARPRPRLPASGDDSDWRCCSWPPTAPSDRGDGSGAPGELATVAVVLWLGFKRRRGRTGKPSVAR